MKSRMQISIYTKGLFMLLCCALLLVSTDAQAQQRPKLRLPDPGLPQENKDSSLIVFTVTTKDYPVVQATVSLIADEINPVATRQHYIASEMSTSNGKFIFKIPDEPELRDKLWIQVTHPGFQSARFRFDELAANNFKCIVEERWDIMTYCTITRCPPANVVGTCLSSRNRLKDPDYTPLPQILKNMGYY